MGRRRLPMPEHFDPARAERIDHRVSDALDLQARAQAFAARHGLEPAGADRVRVQLLVIDAQVDFSFPQGALYVAGRSGRGGLEANLALARFVYSNLDRITEITCTLDSHTPYQIFFPAAHRQADGSRPPPYTQVDADDVRRGRLRPDPALARQLGVSPDWLGRQFADYCDRLAAAGKHPLTLWPYHCLLGSDGHRLAGLVEEARLFHALARGAADRLVLKGHNPLSERYSVFQEEVLTCFDGRPIPGARRETELLETLLEADALVVAGLASSHCVRESVADLLVEIRARDPALARKVYLLDDCTAPVVVPGADHTEAAEQAFVAFAEAGMHRVRSTEPLDDWPGFPPG